MFSCYWFDKNIVLQAFLIWFKVSIYSIKSKMWVQLKSAKKMQASKSMQNSLKMAMLSGNDIDTTVDPEIVWFSIFSLSINFVLIYFLFSRPEQFSKALGRRTPADRVQGTISLIVTVIEPNRTPGESKLRCILL